MDEIERELNLRRLQRSIAAKLGRWGAFMMYSESQNAEATRQYLAENWPSQIVLDASAFEDWFALETHMAEIAGQTSLIQVTGLDDWLTERFIRGMNLRREQFAHSVHAPVLLWLNANTLREVATKAPDLWSWRTGVFD